MFEFIPLENGFAVAMGSELDNVDQCVERIRAHLERTGRGEHLFAIVLLAREALNNAIVHGNRRDSGKKVRFRLTERDGGFDLEIEDEGDGFPWREHLLAISKAEDVRGRGHEIYRNYARAVSYNDKGNALKLEYRG